MRTQQRANGSVRYDKRRKNAAESDVVINPSADQTEA